VIAEIVPKIGIVFSIFRATKVSASPALRVELASAIKRDARFWLGTAYAMTDNNRGSNKQ